MKFIDIEQERTALGFRDVVATEGGIHHARQDQAAEDIGIVRADAPRSEVDDQDPAFVHDAAKPQGLGGFANCATDQWMRKEGAELGEAVYAEDGVTPMRDEDAKPFAGLAALRAKMSPEGGAD